MTVRIVAAALQAVGISAVLFAAWHVHWIVGLTLAGAAFIAVGVYIEEVTRP